MSADYVYGPYRAYDHGDWLHVVHENGGTQRVERDELDAMESLWALKEAGDGRKQSRVVLHRAQVGYVAEALYRLPVECRYHGDDFAKLGVEPSGEPRCDSCKPPWWRRRALAILAGPEADED